VCLEFGVGLLDFGLFDFRPYGSDPTPNSTASLVLWGKRAPVLNFSQPAFVDLVNLSCGLFICVSS